MELVAQFDPTSWGHMGEIRAKEKTRLASPLRRFLLHARQHNFRVAYLLCSVECAANFAAIQEIGLVDHRDRLVVRGLGIPEVDTAIVRHQFHDTDWIEESDVVILLRSAQSGLFPDEVRFELLALGKNIAIFDRIGVPSSLPQTPAPLIQHYRGIRYCLNSDSVVPSHYANSLYIDRLHRIIEENKSRHLLDMFSGQGSIGISLYYESDTLEDVVLAEINPNQVKAIKRTIKLNGAEHHGLEIIHSDLFAAIPGQRKFDLITGNPPHQDRPYDPSLRRRLDVQGADSGWETHRRFFMEAPEYLAENGIICLVESYYKEFSTADVFRKLLQEINSPLVIFEERPLVGTEWFTLMFRLKKTVTSRVFPSE